MLVGGLLGVSAREPAFTKLKKVLVLDKSQGGVNTHRESRVDLNRALAELAAEKGFQVTTLGQNDPASRIAEEFSPTGLAAYQAVLFSNNDGVHVFLDSAQKRNFENYVKDGGGFVPVHAASAFISGWPWITAVLVESFYGPFTFPHSKGNLSHDHEGMAEGAETRGIFQGLTAPPAFMDEFYSFRATPRGRPGVTILLTVDERSLSEQVSGPMGDDHPIAWAKTEGLGRVAHISLGHSMSTNNVYAAKDGYLKKFLYGALRYVAGDFTGCTDSRYQEYNPDATRSDPGACREPVSIAPHAGGGRPVRTVISHGGRDSRFVEVSIRTGGRHEVTLLDMAGRVLFREYGMGQADIPVPLPVRSGLYLVVAKSGGEEIRHRVTLL
jgi:hypothetical protein